MTQEELFKQLSQLTESQRNQITREIVALHQRLWKKKMHENCKIYRNHAFLCFKLMT